MKHFLHRISGRHVALIPLLLLVQFFTVLPFLLYGQNLQAPQIQWDKTIGGNDSEVLTSLQQTADGGYILGGYSNSPAGFDKSENSKGGYDYWILKLDSTGNKAWDKTFGGSGGDFLSVVQQTLDGGYILGGTSGDYWIVKLDSAGNKEWDKTIGGNSSDELRALKQTTDGGFILGGTSYSNAGYDKSENSKGGGDYWIVKLNASGNKEWDKTIGGDELDNLTSLQQTSDGGYILGGGSSSSAGFDKSENSKGPLLDWDYWIVKLDAAGNKQWDKTIGGLSDDYLTCLQQTTDRGYILGGWSTSRASFDKSENPKGIFDYWVVKLDAAGSKEWDKTIGGTNIGELMYSQEMLISLQQTKDGGYILGGFSSSQAGFDKSEDSKGDSDYWIVKLDYTGNKQWDKTIGGTHGDELSSLQQTKDGGFILGGYSVSNVGADKSENTRGDREDWPYDYWDYWVVKLSSDTTQIHARITNFTLVNADTDQDIGHIIEGDLIDLLASGYPVVSVRANTTPAKVDSVIFEFRGSNIATIRQVERIMPYSLYTNSGTDYLGNYWLPGQYTLKATPYLHGRADSTYRINFTVVGNLEPVLQVNFQDRNSQPPQGWVKDYGLPFGQKSFYQYGWKKRADDTPVDLSIGGTFPGNGRRRPAPADVLLSTLLHMQGDDVKGFRGTPVESYWELAVENGEYLVSVSVGDGSVFTLNSESHSINIEGTAAIEGFVPQGTAGSMSRFKQASMKITVDDGYLTITAHGGTNTKINYAIIQPLSSSAAIAKAEGSSLLQAAELPIKAYPNPFTDKLQVATRLSGRVQVGVYDLIGNHYYQATHQLEAGTVNVDLSAVELKSGLYLLKVTAEDGTTQLFKVLKQ